MTAFEVQAPLDVTLTDLMHVHTDCEQGRFSVLWRELWRRVSCIATAGASCHPESRP